MINTQGEEEEAVIVSVSLFVDRNDSLSVGAEWKLHYCPVSFVSSSDEYSPQLEPETPRHSSTDMEFYRQEEAQAI